MSTWEQRMSQRHHRNLDAEIARKRREYLGRVFLKFYPPDIGREWGLEPQVDILPQIIAARCLGIEDGDPGPRLPADRCRECWGERYVWLGNVWGLEHAGGTMSGCKHACHDGEVWLAAAQAIRRD